MKAATPRVLALVCAAWLVVLGCRTADIVTIGLAGPTRTPTRVPLRRPTDTPMFPGSQSEATENSSTPAVAEVRAAPLTPTSLAAVLYPTITAVPTIPFAIPTVFIPPATATRRPIAAATQSLPTPIPPTPAPPPPTSDGQEGYYYHYRMGACVSSDNTRIQGTVYDKGQPVNGITLQVTGDPDGPPINRIMTGVDPADPKHTDPALKGKFRLGIKEGGYEEGYWYIFVVSTDGVAETAKAVIHTDAGPGCNIATVDWYH